MPLSRRTLFAVTAALMGFFGAGFVLAPGAVFGLYGVALDAAGVMLARVAGAAVLALAVLAWLSRDAAGSEPGRAAATALLCFFVVKTTVTVLAQLGGVFNALGWSIVALDAALLLAHAYALFARRGTAAAAPASA